MSGGPTLLAAAYSEIAGLLRLTFDGPVGFSGAADAVEFSDAGGTIWKTDTQVGVGVAAPFGCDLLFSVIDTGLTTLALEQISLWTAAAFHGSGGGPEAVPPTLPFSCPTVLGSDDPQLWYAHFDGLGFLDMWFTTNMATGAGAGDVVLRSVDTDAWTSVSTLSGTSTPFLTISMGDSGPVGGPYGEVTTFNNAAFISDVTSNPCTALATPFPLNEE